MKSFGSTGAASALCITQNHWTSLVQSFKVGDLVKDTAGSPGPIGIIVSLCRRSTPGDNRQLGLMYGDVVPVIDVLIAGKKYVYDVDFLELVNECR